MRPARSGTSVRASISSGWPRPAGVTHSPSGGSAAAGSWSPTRASRPTPRDRKARGGDRRERGRSTRWPGRAHRPRAAPDQGPAALRWPGRQRRVRRGRRRGRQRVDGPPAGAGGPAARRARGRVGRGGPPSRQHRAVAAGRPGADPRPRHRRRAAAGSAPRSVHRARRAGPRPGHPPRPVGPPRIGTAGRRDGAGRRVAAMVAAARSNDVAAFGRAIDDRIAEPVRAPLLPGFTAAKRAALAAGAYGCSISEAAPPRSR